MKHKTMHNVRFAERLKSLIDAKGLNQLQLQKETGLTNQAVSLWLQGRYYPSFVSLCDLADYFDISVDYLIGRED